MIAPASRKIGKYEIVRKLGRGGMADVYLAQDSENGGAVALKLIEHASDADGFFFVAMEYVEGQDLAELMRHGPLALGFATDVAIAVAKTLDNAHNLEIAIDGKDFRGVVHGLSLIHISEPTRLGMIS